MENQTNIQDSSSYNENIKQAKLYLLITSIFLIIYLLVFSQFVDFLKLKSVFSGVMVVWVNIVGLMIISYLILSKKLIALVVGIIVLKYPILGLVIYKLYKTQWFDSLYFVLGMIGFIVPTLIYSLVYKNFYKTEG